MQTALTKMLNVPQNALHSVLAPYQAKIRILSALKKEKPLYKRKIELPNYPLTKQEKQYLFDRHFDPYALQEQFNIQGGGYLNAWKNRIIIPVYINLKLVSWVGRTILPGREPRYKFLANEKSVINPKTFFFNLDNCSNEYVAVLEGPFDVMRFGNDSICGFGISLTRVQLMCLSERFKKIYFIFDNERQAQKKAREYAMLLCGHGLDAYTVDISGYGVNDVAELSPFNARKLKKEIFNAYNN